MKRLVLALAALAAIGATGCVVTTTSSGTASTYDLCSTDSDCISASDTCVQVSYDDGSGVVSTDNMCSRDCTSDADCGGGACYDVGGSGVNICYQLCSSDLDCPGTWVCVATTGGTPGDMICLP